MASFTLGCRSGSRWLKARCSRGLSLTRSNGCSLGIAAWNWRGRRSTFDFAVDVTAVYERKLEALTVYESVFSGSQAELLDKYTAEDRYIGSLVGVRYAEAFKSRSPLLVADPEAFAPSRFG
jgi:hypothetical protein